MTLRLPSTPALALELGRGGAQGGGDVSGLRDALQVTGVQVRKKPHRQRQRTLRVVDQVLLDAVVAKPVLAAPDVADDIVNHRARRGDPLHLHVGDGGGLDVTYRNHLATADSAESGGLVLLGISIDTKGNRVVKPFFNKLEYTYPMLADPTEGDDEVIRSAKDMKSQYKVQAIPVVYLIDSKGIIQHAHTGFKEKDIVEIEKAINELPKENSR